MPSVQSLTKVIAGTGVFLYLPALIFLIVGLTNTINGQWQLTEQAVALGGANLVLGQLSYQFHKHIKFSAKELIAVSITGIMLLSISLIIGMTFLGTSYLTF